MHLPLPKSKEKGIAIKTKTNLGRGFHINWPLIRLVALTKLGLGHKFISHRHKRQTNLGLSGWFRALKQFVSHSQKSKH